MPQLPNVLRNAPPRPHLAPPIVGGPTSVLDDDTAEATGFVGDRALAFRKPDDGATFVISTVVPLENGFFVWLTDENGNGLDGTGVGAPDDDH